MVKDHFITLLTNNHYVKHDAKNSLGEDIWLDNDISNRSDITLTFNIEHLFKVTVHPFKLG